MKNFIIENANVAKELISGKVGIVHKDVSEIGNDEGAVVRHNGKRAGAYKDTSGKLFWSIQPARIWVAKWNGMKENVRGIALATVPASILPAKSLKDRLSKILKCLKPQNKQARFGLQTRVGFRLRTEASYPGFICCSYGKSIEVKTAQP